MGVAWGAVAWVASHQAPLPPAVEPGAAEVSAPPEGEKQLSAHMLPPVTRPDNRKPLEPTRLEASDLGLPGLAALSTDAQDLALGVLNNTTGACDPCQAEGLSMAACLRENPPGCQNMPALARRVIRGAARGDDIQSVRAEVRYDDSWFPIAPAERPARGGPAGAHTLLVVVDYISPFSAEAEAEFDALSQRFGEELRVEVLQAPRPALASIDAAEAALAAELAGCFWPAHAALLRSASQGEAWKVAETACGAPLDGYREQAKLRLRQDQALAATLGVRGTPTVFIDGYRVRGLRGLEEYAHLIELQIADEEG